MIHTSMTFSVGINKLITELKALGCACAGTKVCLVFCYQPLIKERVKLWISYLDCKACTRAGTTPLCCTSDLHDSEIKNQNKNYQTSRESMDRQKKNLKLKYIEITKKRWKPYEKNNSLSLKQVQRARIRRGKTCNKGQVQVIETGVTHTKLSKTCKRRKSWESVEWML